MWKQNKNIDWRRVSIHFMIISFLMVLVNLGMLMNFLAVKNNGGRMPFIASYEYENNTHFSFQDYVDINSDLFVDRFRLFNMIFSIGDFVMLFGTTGLFINAIIMFKRGIKKDERNYDTN